MVKHYFKVTFRHIRKHLLISILNIAGLAIGIACFVLIMLYVNYELNYDKFNEHYDDIYRIGVEAQFGNTAIRQTWTPAPMPAAMYEEYPEIRKITQPDFTASFGVSGPKVSVTAEEKIPEQYWKPQDPKLDRVAIAAALKAGLVVPGAELTNGNPFVSVRTR